jgi:hypothetical protein
VRPATALPNRLSERARAILKCLLFARPAAEQTKSENQKIRNFQAKWLLFARPAAEQTESTQEISP